jgi:phosphopantothenoylcysteine decarboxylase
MILLGVTGSVAAILSHKIVEQLKKYDSQVEVILTHSSLAFVDMLKLSKVATRIWFENDEWEWQIEHTDIPLRRNMWKKDDPILHIELSKRADIFVIAPATANTIAKLDNGICDNLLTSVFRAWNTSSSIKPIFVAPAMNTQMWDKRITRLQISNMRKDGVTVIDPQSKLLACGDTGMGALADISDIVKQVANRSTPVDKWWFPLKQCNGIPLNPHPGAFGYVRKNSKHTGVDLYTREGAGVYAVEPGKIVSVEHFTGEWDGSPWWNNTDCILVEGETGVVCYGEIRTERKVGEYVKKGEHIGNVTRVIKEGREHPEITGWSPSMLHLELYYKGQKKASYGFTDELRDPTQLLLDAYDGPNKSFTYDLYKPQ